MSNKHRWSKRGSQPGKPKTHPNQTPAAQDKADVAKDTESSPVAEVHLPPSPANKEHTEHKQEKPYEGATLVVSVLTLIVVSIYAYFTYQQMCATQHLVTISQNQQRPYVLARPVPRNPKGIIFRQLPYSPPKGTTGIDSYDMHWAVEFDVELRNTGQSPAINAIGTPPFSTFTPKG